MFVPVTSIETKYPQVSSWGNTAWMPAPDDLTAQQPFAGATIVPSGPLYPGGLATGTLPVLGMPGIAWSFEGQPVIAQPVQSQQVFAQSFPTPTRLVHRRMSLQLILFVAGILAGALAVVLAWGAWPILSATRLGLGPRGAFCLLTSGVYILAAAAYSAARTRLLCRLGTAAWDVRSMAYSVIGVGAVCIGSLTVVILAICALVGLLAGLVLLTRSNGPP